MDAVIAKKTTLSEMAKELVLFPQVLVNVRVSDKYKCMEDADVKKVADEVTKKLGSDGRLLLRASGTESVVRIMVEAKDESTCKASAKEIEDAIIKKGYAI